METGRSHAVLMNVAGCWRGLFLRFNILTNRGLSYTKGYYLKTSLFES